MNLGARKPLFFQTFRNFEPQRSNPAKQFSGNGLTLPTEKYNIWLDNKLAHKEFTGISTVRGGQ
jgi:hypothetical protein